MFKYDRARSAFIFLLCSKGIHNGCVLPKTSMTGLDSGYLFCMLCCLDSAKRRQSIYFVAAELVLVYIDYTPLGHFYILPIRTWAQILTDWTSFYDPLDYTNINQIISDQSLKKNEFWVPMCTHFTTQ